MPAEAISWWVAFGAGVLSFFSPCTLPLYPSYLGYISGVSLAELRTPGTLAMRTRWRALAHAACFCVGLGCLFVVLGLSATAMGQALIHYRSLVRIVGGIFVILMGLVLAGVIRTEGLLREWRLSWPARKPAGYVGSALVGVVFAAGWTPCIGPILSSVLAMTLANPEVGWRYMAAYAAGFALPFLVLAAVLPSIRPLVRHTAWVAKVSGWLLVCTGFLLLSGKLALLAAWLQRVTGMAGF